MKPEVLTFAAFQTPGSYVGWGLLHEGDADIKTSSTAEMIHGPVLVMSG